MSTLPFRKLHGSANDFVYVDARRGLPVDPEVLAPRVCDRHRGIGADGLILLLESKVADCRMRIVNADGSVPLSAVLSGVKDIRDAIAQAELTLQQSGHHTILFVDEGTALTNRSRMRSSRSSRRGCSPSSARLPRTLRSN